MRKGVWTAKEVIAAYCHGYDYAGSRNAYGKRVRRLREGWNCTYKVTLKIEESKWRVQGC